MRSLSGLVLALALPFCAGRAASLAIPATTHGVPAGTVVELPVTGDLPQAEQILSLECSLRLPTNWVITGLAPGAGLLAQQGATIGVEFQGNELDLAASAITPLSGTGPLFVIQAQVDGSGWGDLLAAVANEGTPSVSMSDGYQTHTPPPPLGLTPNTAQNLLPGETVAFSCPSAQAPLVWSVQDPAIGSITAGGLFTATAPGQTRVLLEDGAGSQGQSQLITVYSHGLTINPVTGMAGQELVLELVLANPANLAFGSVLCRVDLNTPRLGLLSLETAGTLCEGWSGLQALQQGDVLVLAGAHSQTVSGAGVLARFRLSSSPGTAVNTTLVLDQADLDESHTVRRGNGSLALTATGTFTLGPSTQILKRGETRTLSVGGSPNGALSYSSSHPAVATINGAGLVTALAGGTVSFIAVDELGQTAGTGDWQVYDLDARLETQFGIAQGASALVPVWCDSLVGLEVQALEVDLGWTASVLSVIGVETEGSLCEGLEVAFFGDSLSAGFSAAGLLPGTAGLPLVWLECALDWEAVPDQLLPLSLSVLKNEGFPVVRSTAGSIRVELGTGLAEPPALPAGLALHANWPNPFNPETRISFRLEQAGPASLVVFDLTGRRVATLIAGPLDGGLHHSRWDGRDDRGLPAASGSYLLQLRSGDRQQCRRITLLR